jgi:hypothetical protein
MTDFDLGDIVLEAQADVQEILREFFAELAEPAMMRQLKMMWFTIPDEMKEQFKKDRPEEFAALMKVVEEKIGG